VEILIGIVIFTVVFGGFIYWRIPNKKSNTIGAVGGGSSKSHLNKKN